MTWNLEVYGNKNSFCVGARLKGSIDLASVTPSNLNSVPPLENSLETSMSVVDDEG
jgi:hypothetical protein